MNIKLVELNTCLLVGTFSDRDAPSVSWDVANPMRVEMANDGFSLLPVGMAGGATLALNVSDLRTGGLKTPSSQLRDRYLALLG